MLIHLVIVSVFCVSTFAQVDLIDDIKTKKADVNAPLDGDLESLALYAKLKYKASPDGMSYRLDP